MTKSEQPNEAKPARDAIDALLRRPRVINVGLEQFASDLATQGVEVIHVDWSPPAASDSKLGSLLAKLGS